MLCTHCGNESLVFCSSNPGLDRKAAFTADLNRPGRLS
jgi:hypothetical protein